MERLSNLSKSAKDSLLENIGANENYLCTEYTNKDGKEFTSQDEFVCFLIDAFFDNKEWQKKLVQDMKHDIKLCDGEFPDLDKDYVEVIDFLCKKL